MYGELKRTKADVTSWPISRTVSMRADRWGRDSKRVPHGHKPNGLELERQVKQHCTYRRKICNL